VGTNSNYSTSEGLRVMANSEPVKRGLTLYNTYSIWQNISQIILFDSQSEAEGYNVDVVKLYLTGKIKRKVLGCLIKHKATYIKEIQRETGESKQIIDYHLLQWVKHGSVKRYPVEFKECEGYKIFALVGTDSDIVIDTKMRLRREVLASKMGENIVDYMQLAPEIAQAIHQRYGLKPSQKEIKTIVREYGIRGNSVPFMEREVFTSLKQLREAS
jgi:hypothetical protein